MTKRSIIAGLVGVNLLLLGLMVVETYSLPAAFAAGGRGGTYACVTAKVAGQSHDVVYVLAQTRNGDKLHAYYPTSIQANKFGHAKPRDLDKDFDRNTKP